jgi:hypothetical protein
MKPNLILGSLTLILCTSASLRGAPSLETLKGSCSVSAAQDANKLELELKVDDSYRGHSNFSEPADSISGLTPGDLQHDGARATAVLQAPAGRVECSGTVREYKLSGEFTFTPDAAFADQLDRMGFHDLDSKKLEAYTLFRIDSSWIRSLQNTGVSGLDSGNLIALHIFDVNAAYIESFTSLGYGTPDAGKLVAMKVQGVDPAQVREIRALGYQPTLDELIQMRIFRVTPDFIRRMQAKGFSDLSIHKLVQIRIFNLAE